MQLDVVVVTLFPELVTRYLSDGVIGRAVRSGLVSVRCVNPRDFAQDRHRTVDDRSYGGGPGMVMKVEPLLAALEFARNSFAEPLEHTSELGAQVLLPSPQGELLNNGSVQELAGTPRWIVVCGRYEGLDERFVEQHVDREISVGDYVLSGGELPFLIMLDAAARQLPGVLGSHHSAEEDSFADGLLDHPHYTRFTPAHGEAQETPDSTSSVPEVLTSGHHADIAQWRRRQRLWRTLVRRPDLLEQSSAAVTVSEAEQQWLLAELDGFVARRKKSLGAIPGSSSD